MTTEKRDDARNSDRDEARDAQRDEARDAKRDQARDLEHDDYQDAELNYARSVGRTDDPFRARKVNRDHERDESRDRGRDENRDTARNESRDSERDRVRDAARDQREDAVGSVASSVRDEDVRLIVSIGEQCRSRIRGWEEPPLDQPASLQLKHLEWMSGLIVERADAWPKTKLHRWIGFVQAGMIANRMLRLQDAKRMLEEAGIADPSLDQDLLDHLNPDDSFELDIGGQG